MKLLSSSKKKKILKQLNQQFGIQKLPYLLLQFGQNKIRFYSRALSKDELIQLDKNINIKNIGLYALKHEKNEICLTLNGIQLLKSQITKNILKITDSQAEQWLKGNDLQIQTTQDYKILKNNNEFIGCGKSDGGKITNSIPKEKRIPKERKIN